MKKLLRLSSLLTFILLFAAGCRKEISEELASLNELNITTECGVALVKDLWDMGGEVKRGNVVVVNDNNYITLRVSADGPVYVKKMIAVYGSQEHVRAALSETVQWTPCDGPAHPDTVKTSAPKLAADSLQIPVSAFQSDNCTWISLYVTLTDDAGFEWCTFVRPFEDSIQNVSIWKTLFKYCNQCPQQPPPGECVPVEKDLWDQGDVAKRGSLSIVNDNDNITLTVSAFSNLFVKKTIVAFGSREHVESVLTQTTLWTPCAGPSVPDRVKESPAGMAMDTLKIPSSAFQADGCVWIAAFVTLSNSDGFEWCTYPKPFDASIQGVSVWKAFFKYCKGDCPNGPPTPPGEPNNDCGPLRTQTPGGWGAKPNGDNPGTYLHANFAAAFPQGIAVGCFPADHYLQLTSADAITEYLPSGGEPGALGQNYVDPENKKIKNSLAQHLVALTLNVGFDMYDADFGKADVHLGDMIITRGTFEGWTVNAFLAAANKELGGCTDDYKLKKLTETAEKINESFKDGKKNDGDGDDDDDNDDDHNDDHDKDGFLKCPD